jgi:phosphoglycolate phosphatase
MIKLILFDIDGTLIRSAGAGSMAFGRAFGTLFNLPEGAASLDFAGRTDSSLFAEFLDNHSIEGSEDLEASFFHVYTHWLGELLPQVEGAVLPGVTPLLEELESSHAHIHLGLLTGNTRLAAEVKLRHFDLWRGFKLGSFGDDHHCRNELARLAVARARQILGDSLQSDEILIIGDTPSDVECAQSIGAKSLAVATGKFDFASLSKTGSTRAVKMLTDIQVEEMLRL